MLLIATLEALSSLVSHQTTDKQGFGDLWRTGLIGGRGTSEAIKFVGASKAHKKAKTDKGYKDYKATKKEAK